MKSNTLLILATLILFTTHSYARYYFVFDYRTDSPVMMAADGSLIDGTSSVIRHKDSVAFNFDARNLLPGHAYTLWIMHFDKPLKCLNPCKCNLNDFVNDEVQSGAIGGMAGRVSDAYGQVSMSNVVKYGAVPSNPDQILVAPGEIVSERSHFLLALRDHGPASSDPVILQEQLSGWSGGCSADNPCTDVVMSDHPSPFCRAWP